VQVSEQIELDGVEHGSVALDGFDAHVATAGAQGGAPVVLLHGWPLHWWSFRHLIRAFAEDGRRVIAPDLRGFGWSGTPGWGYAPPQFTEDLFALLDALGLDQVDLVGHDWGCFVGYRAALEQPDRFRRFAAMSVPGPHTRYTPGTVASLWRYWYWQPLAAPAIGPRTVRRMASPRSLVGRWIGLHRTTPEVVAAYMLQFRDPARVAASVALYRDALLHALATRWQPEYRRARLRVTTLHIHGTKDGPTSPAFVRPMAARSDDWRLELLDGVGHFLLDEAPERVEDLVRPFLAR
jgi:pimeloyl-ACP methyl ester carboxylesterase